MKIDLRLAAALGIGAALTSACKTDLDKPGSFTNDLISSC
jgi:hypothetical protein